MNLLRPGPPRFAVQHETLQLHRSWGCGSMPAGCASRGDEGAGGARTMSTTSGPPMSATATASLRRFPPEYASHTLQRSALHWSPKIVAADTSSTDCHAGTVILTHLPQARLIAAVLSARSMMRPCSSGCLLPLQRKKPQRTADLF